MDELAALQKQLKKLTQTSGVAPSRKEVRKISTKKNRVRRFPGGAEVDVRMYTTKDGKLKANVKLFNLYGKNGRWDLILEGFTVYAGGKDRYTVYPPTVGKDESGQWIQKYPKSTWLFDDCRTAIVRHLEEGRKKKRRRIKHPLWQSCLDCDNMIFNVRDGVATCSLQMMEQVSIDPEKIEESPYYLQLGNAFFYLGSQTEKKLQEIDLPAYFSNAELLEKLFMELENVGVRCPGVPDQDVLAPDGEPNPSIVEALLFVLDPEVQELLLGGTVTREQYDRLEKVINVIENAIPEEKGYTMRFATRDTFDLFTDLEDRWCYFGKHGKWHYNGLVKEGVE
jgi:hypothetical protein